MDRIRAEIIAPHAGNFGQTVRAAALRQRRERYCVSHCRHAFAARTRASEIDPFLPGRPHGRRQCPGGDHCLVKRKVELVRKPESASFVRAGCKPAPTVLAGCAAVGAAGLNPAGFDCGGSGPEGNRCAAGAEDCRSAVAGAMGRPRA